LQVNARSFFSGSKLLMTEGSLPGSINIWPHAAVVHKAEIAGNPSRMDLLLRQDGRRATVRCEGTSKKGKLKV
jgi:hypothetical protein